jgi:hypothetical protein
MSIPLGLKPQEVAVEKHVYLRGARPVTECIASQVIIAACLHAVTWTLLNFPSSASHPGYWITGLIGIATMVHCSLAPYLVAQLFWLFSLCVERAINGSWVAGAIRGILYMQVCKRLGMPRWFGFFTIFVLDAVIISYLPVVPDLASAGAQSGSPSSQWNHAEWNDPVDPTPEVSAEDDANAGARRPEGASTKLSNYRAQQKLAKTRSPFGVDVGAFDPGASLIVVVPGLMLLFGFLYVVALVVMFIRGQGGTTAATNPYDSRVNELRDQLSKHNRREYRYWLTHEAVAHTDETERLSRWLRRAEYDQSDWEQQERERPFNEALEWLPLVTVFLIVGAMAGALYSAT